MYIYKELCIYIYIHKYVYINIDANAQHTHTHQRSVSKQKLQHAFQCGIETIISQIQPQHMYAAFLSIQRVPPNLVETNKEDIHKCHFFYVMIFYFYLVCFTFSISYSVFPFQLVYAFQFLPFFFCLMVFLKPFSSVVEKLLHAYV